MSEMRERIGRTACDNSQGSSQGKCLIYVRRAIQQALGLPVQGIGVDSAKDVGPWLVNVGFSVVNTSNYQNGDVIVISGSANHPHGHVQVYYNGGWYSDFGQNYLCPYKDKTMPSYKVYRY